MAHSEICQRGPILLRICKFLSTIHIPLLRNHHPPYRADQEGQNSILSTDWVSTQVFPYSTKSFCFNPCACSPQPIMANLPLHRHVRLCNFRNPTSAG